MKNVEEIRNRVILGEYGVKNVSMVYNIMDGYLYGYRGAAGL